VFSGVLEEVRGGRVMGAHETRKGPHLGHRRLGIG
jgi:hypothetical protein